MTITAPTTRSHLDINDSIQRADFARTLGISEERLRRGVRIVGSRISTLRSHFA
jgi:hypothetical protein